MAEVTRKDMMLKISSNLARSNPPEREEFKAPPRHPARYTSKRKAIIRLREWDGENMGEEIQQHEGVVYKLDPKDESTLALYGGHQVIVLNTELVDFERWTIVSITELW